MVTYLPATSPGLALVTTETSAEIDCHPNLHHWFRFPPSGPPQSYCLGFPNRTPQVQKTEAMTGLGQDFLNLSPSSLAAPSSLLTSQALISKCAHVLSPASLATLDHLAVPQFCKHLLRPLSENCASFQLPPPPPSPNTRHLFPASPACRLRDSRRRSPGPAGAAGEETLHGWLRHQPPSRLQGQRRMAAAEARPESAAGVGRARRGRGEALGGLLSRSFQSCLSQSVALRPAWTRTLPAERAWDSVGSPVHPPTPQSG